jgi:hypothetical protein
VKNEPHSLSLYSFSPRKGQIEEFHGHEGYRDYAPFEGMTIRIGNTGLVTRSFTGFEVSTRRGVCRVR